MKTKLPERVTLKGSCSTGAGDGAETTGGAAGFCAPGWGELAAAASFVGPSGVTGTGGKTVGRKVSSLGANLLASSFVGNSIATKTAGTSVRAGQVANIKRDEPRASEFFFKKLIIDLNCGPGSASLTIGSTISPAPPLLRSWPTFRTSP